MITRIIFFVVSPFNLRDYQRFGIEILQQNDFKVEVWDITPILHPIFYNSYSPPDPFNYEGLTLFRKKNELYSKISVLENSDFVINIIPYNFESLWIYRVLSKSEADYAVFMANALPSISNEKLKVLICLKKIKKLFKLSPKKVWGLFLSRIPFRWFGVESAKICLAGGEKCLVYHYPTDANTEVLWAHTLDHDLYLKERNNPSVERPIVVFLDEYLPFHPDFIVAGIKPYIAPDRYYFLLNKFFKLIENQLGLEVIIAAHPRSHYENYPDYFEGRKCIRGQSVKLVRESKLILSHSSTALSFANLFYRPVVFITSSELNRGYQGPFIKEMAKRFGKKPIFIDKDNNIDWEFELTVDKNYYDNYRRDYIKTKHSEDLPFWQIVANRLKEGF